MKLTKRIARRCSTFCVFLILVLSCAGPLDPEPVEVRIGVVVEGARLEVEMAGDLGAADTRRLWMAAGAVGSYSRTDFTPFVDGLRAWNGRGSELAVERHEGGWRLAGNGQLSRVAYRVDVQALTAQLDASVASVLDQEGGFLFGYGVFVMPEGIEDRKCRVRLELPPKWRVAWALPREEDGTYLADDFFHLLDEPLMTGTAFRSVELEGVVPRRVVHALTDGSVDAEAAVRKLASAAEVSARALEVLGTPQRPNPYHIFFTVREPKGEERLGWALEHGYSFHCVAGPDMVDWPQARLVYHLLHHEMHAWMPRRLYTDRLHPRRQWLGETSAFVWFAEGFPQYLSMSAMAKSGTVTREQALRMLARRFAGPYLRLGPRVSMSMTQLSEKLSAGDHEHWFFGFAGGGLLAMMIDQQMRDRDAEYGLLEAMLTLSERWIDDPKGIPEAEFEGAFSEAVGFDVRPLFARYVRGSERLPVLEILAGAGIESVAGGADPAIWGSGGGFEVLEEDRIGAGVLTFRRSAF